MELKKLSDEDVKRIAQKVADKLYTVPRQPAYPPPTHPWLVPQYPYPPVIYFSTTTGNEITTNT